jgi:hypothetical protein
MRRLCLLVLAAGFGVLVVSSLVSARSAASITVSVSSPLLAGATGAMMTVSGTAAPGSYIQPWVNLKPAAAHCNADPHLDDGNEIDQASPDYANGDGSYSFTWRWLPTESTGTFLLCAWLLQDGAVAAQSQQTVTVVKPPVTLSLSGVPAKLAQSLSQTSFGTLHVDVGATTRLVDWFENPAAQGCPKDPSQGWLPSAEVSGKQTIAITERSSGLSGRYVLCVYVGDVTGKEIDGMVTSGVIVVGGGNAQPAQASRWLGRTSLGVAFELDTLGATVTGFSYPHTKLPCTGTHPAITSVEWFTPISSIALPIHTGAFHGTVKYTNGNTVTIHGTVKGPALHGTITDTLRPISSTHITDNSPPYSPVTGGLCQATFNFNATHH